MRRRTFLASTAAVAGLPATALTSHASPRPGASARSTRSTPRADGPCVIASGNGLNAVIRAMEELRAGADPAVAVVEGVTLVEDDPNDMSVGYGGLPNADGVVQLDASVMHGPTHKAGAVASLERIRNAAKVALEVLRRTDHVLLVGPGALRFAIEHGFEEQELLTERSRAAWLRWRRNGNPRDAYLDDDQTVPIPEARLDAPETHGTIHCSALDANGDLAGVTTTSGLSWKIPGRVGDSPIVGAGMFVDNEVGAAGSTGRGESVIQSCGSFQIVQRMAAGVEPEQACLEALRWIERHTKRAELLDDEGRPSFGVSFYALRKDGAYGGACFRNGSYAVHDGKEARKVRCTPLYG